MPTVQHEAWFTPRLLSHLGVRKADGCQGEGRQGEGHQGKGHRGEGHRGEGHLGDGHRGEEHRGHGHPGDGHQGDFRNFPFGILAAAPHRHPRCSRLPQCVAELAPLGDVFAASQARKTPLH